MLQPFHYPLCIYRYSRIVESTITTVQRIMAHQDIRTTLRYAKVVDASVKKGMMMMDEM